jgi:hypothetical protein
VLCFALKKNSSNRFVSLHQKKRKRQSCVHNYISLPTLWLLRKRMKNPDDFIGAKSNGVYLKALFLSFLYLFSSTIFTVINQRFRFIKRRRAYFENANRERWSVICVKMMPRKSLAIRSIYSPIFLVWLITGLGCKCRSDFLSCNYQKYSDYTTNLQACHWLWTRYSSSHHICAQELSLTCDHLY